MELGLTIPLQRRLKVRGLPPGGKSLPHCWDAHVITLHGRPCLLGVHCLSRCVFLLFDPPPPDWADIGEAAREAALRLLLDEGLPHPCALACAGPAMLTRTHGRREVAFLNRAWEDVLSASQAVDPFAVPQPLLERIVNGLPCRCAGEDGLRPASEHLRRLMQR